MCLSYQTRMNLPEDINADDQLILSQEQWLFLAVVEAFGEPVSVDLAGKLVPLLPGPLLDLLGKVDSRGWVKRADRNHLSVTDNFGILVPQGHVAPAKNDFVAHRRRRFFRDATALDVQFIHAIHFFRQMAGHDFRQSWFHTAAENDHSARPGCLLFHLNERIGWSLRQIHQWLASLQCSFDG